MMESAKTTLYLPRSLHRQLKALATERGTTMTQLIAEGAKLVLSRERRAEDRQELEQRAASARERLREGLYEGDPVADRADELVYGNGRRKRKPRKR